MTGCKHVYVLATFQQGEPGIGEIVQFTFCVECGLIWVWEDDWGNDDEEKALQKEWT